MAIFTSYLSLPEGKMGFTLGEVDDQPDFQIPTNRW